MSFEILLQKEELYVGNVIIDSWLVDLQQEVLAGQAVCRVKYGDELHEVESPASGILQRKLYQEGERIDGLPILGVVNDSDSSMLDMKPPKDLVIPPEKSVKLKGVRKVVAQRMHESLQNTAQFTIHSVADARSVLAFRKACKVSEFDDVRAISMNDVFLWIISRVLVSHPYMNAIWSSDGIMQRGQINLGFAVDTPRGLIVPVIKNIRMLSLKEVSSEAKKLSRMCISGKFTPDILEEGTFTVTNLGSFGVGMFTPIVNVPQVGILGIGGMELKPILENGQIEHVPHFLLSLTIDHRAVDGVPGARFLSACAKAIAQFQYLTDSLM